MYANPGDTLRIKIKVDWDLPGEHSFGPLWLHRTECQPTVDFVSETMLLTDYIDFDESYDPNAEWAFDQTYIFPNF